MKSGNMIKTAAVAMFVVSLCVLAQAQTQAPIGTLTSGTATIGGSPASVGTAVFPGNQVAAPKGAAAIRLASGGQIELAKGTATFTKDGDTVVVDPSVGEFRFNFLKGEKVKIVADCYDLYADASEGSEHVGAFKQEKGKLDVDMTVGRLTYDSAYGREAVAPQRSLSAKMDAGKCVPTQPSSWSKGSVIGTTAAAVAIGVGVGVAATSGNDEKSPSSR
ncbi:MAG: hypothetical protein LBT74_08425 [Acidobacteriota bacterium]|nr:hypothetical protein [Acidobacteriota bacterium]